MNALTQEGSRHDVQIDTTGASPENLRWVQVSVTSVNMVLVLLPSLSPVDQSLLITYPLLPP